MATGTKRTILFTPGPVMLHPRVKASLTHDEMPHRRGGFQELLQRTSGHIRSLLNARAEDGVALLTGSGSAANECALISLFRTGESAVVVTNGPFGERLTDVLGCHHIPAHVVSHAWASLPDVARVEQALLAHPEATWLCVVWHETGTGMRNPVASLGELAHRMGRRLFVDAVSAFGVEDINVQRDHIDVLTSVANKGVGAVTGLSFVWARQGVVPPLGPDMPRRSMYLSLQNHLTWSRDVHQTPNTPALTAVVAMDEALCLLQEQGMVARTRHLRACSKIVRDGARAMGFSMVLPESQCVDALTSLRLPVDLPVDAFIDVLETRGFVVYPGKGPMHEQNVFQVAVMGHVDTLDCHALVDAMRASATQLRQPGATTRPASAWTAADLPLPSHGGTRDQRTADHR